MKPLTTKQEQALLATIERLEKVFCATGPGGGVDPTCGSGNGSTSFSAAQVKSATEALDALPLAEEGYRTFSDDIPQIRMTEVGFSGMGKGHGNMSERDPIATVKITALDKVKYTQSSVTVSGVKDKLNGKFSEIDSDKTALPSGTIDLNGFLHVSKGHHRVAAQALATGSITVKARMVVPGRGKKTKYGKLKKMPEHIELLEMANSDSDFFG